MSKRAAPAPSAEAGEIKRLKTAVRTLMDELVSAEHEVKVRGEKLALAGTLLTEAGRLLAPHPCCKGNCENDAIVKLHGSHHVCLSHFGAAYERLEFENVGFECPACKETITDGIEIISIERRRSRISLETVEKRCSTDLQKSEEWRAHTRRSLATLLALDPDELFADAGAELDDYKQRKRLCRYESAARPGMAVVDFNWNGTTPAPVEEESAAEEPDQCAQRQD